MPLNEEWRWVVDYEGIYEVSDLGRIRSVDRLDARGHRRKGQMLRPVLDSKGYPQVDLNKDGANVCAKVHRLVLLAFIGPCPDGMEAAHNNGVRSDAKLANLRWSTHSDNELDKRVHGSLVTKSKLQASDVERMFDMRRGGATQQRIADCFGITNQSVNAIFKGRAWARLNLTV